MIRVCTEHYLII